MSNAELISKLKALPARERERVIRAVMFGPKSGTGKHVETYANAKGKMA
jgi:hypothetical protein